MASRKRITSHKKSRQQKKLRDDVFQNEPKSLRSIRLGGVNQKRLRDPLAFEDLTKETTPTVLPKPKPKKPKKPNKKLQVLRLTPVVHYRVKQSKVKN